ncbi:hypothetical protein ACWEQL_19270 [Kitasatospora sp. NPDC004240]
MSATPARSRRAVHAAGPASAVLASLLLLGGCASGGSAGSAGSARTAPGTSADGGASASQPTATASGPASAPPAGGTDGKCPALPDVSDRAAAQGPFPAGDVTWVDFKTSKLPVSKLSGPAVVTGEVARCYARTPRGAVLALANASVRTANADDTKTVVEQLVVGNPDRDLYLATVLHGRGAATSAAAPQGQYAGFRVASYNQDMAEVQLAIRFPNGVHRTVVLLAVWSEGDWKFKVTGTGQQTDQVDQTYSLSSTFVPFSAMSS